MDDTLLSLLLQIKPLAEIKCENRSVLQQGERLHWLRFIINHAHNMLWFGQAKVEVSLVEVGSTFLPDNIVCFSQAPLPSAWLHSSLFVCLFIFTQILSQPEGSLSVVLPLPGTMYCLKGSGQGTKISNAH